MKRYSLTHLSDEILRKELSQKAANENEATAELLAHIAEFDERKLYLPAAYPSMLAYCVGELGLSEEEAKKRIRVARVARTCPRVFEAMAEGRVHLSGLVVLAAHLTPETAEELLAESARKTREEIERLLAERFPKTAMPASVMAITSASRLVGERSPGTVEASEVVANVVSEGSPGTVRARVAPLSAEAFAVQFTRSRHADERFRYAQDLLGHRVKSSDLAEVYERAVEALVDKLEREHFGSGAKSRKGGRTAKAGARRVSFDVKRAAWIRDQGQCTFKSESGHRCEARSDLQYDHVKEFARGGEATVDNIRLRCPGHNQHTAEQTYCAGFMKRKREEAAVARAAAKAAKEHAKAQKAAEREASRLQPHQLEVIPWLRELGCREDHCRIAVERCRDMAGARLEDRVKCALSWFGARLGRKESYVGCAATPA